MSRHSSSDLNQKRLHSEDSNNRPLICLLTEHPSSLQKTIKQDAQNIGLSAFATTVRRTDGMIYAEALSFDGGFQTGVHL
jgi:hypothetical protein